jgi:small conductance mechanosensitive channel
VTLAVAPLTDLTTWARSSGLEILLLVTGAVLLARFIAWGGQLLVRRLDAARPDAPLVPSEAQKHRHALAQVTTWLAQVVVYVVATVLVLQRFHVPLSGLVPVATVAGLALGFGAQRVVGDLLAGFFIVTERQYGYGDVIRLGLASGSSGVVGTVEDVTLRVTQVRTLDGEVVITPNGQIAQVTNLSRDWARAVVDVPVPADADLAQVSATLEEVGREAFEDERLGALLLDPPTVMGVETLEVDRLAVRLVARTLPGQQFEVGRQLRARAATQLRRRGLRVPTRVATANPTGAGT